MVVGMKKASDRCKMFLEVETGCVLYIWAQPMPDSPHAFQRLPLEALPRAVQNQGVHHVTSDIVALLLCCTSRFRSVHRSSCTQWLNHVAKHHDRHVWHVTTLRGASGSPFILPRLPHSTSHRGQHSDQAACRGDIHALRLHCRSSTVV